MLAVLHTVHRQRQKLTRGDGCSNSVSQTHLYGVVFKTYVIYYINIDGTSICLFVALLQNSRKICFGFLVNVGLFWSGLWYIFAHVSSCCNVKKMKVAHPHYH